MANAANLCPTLTFKSWLSSGVPNAFGTVTSYMEGTSTPLATWTDWTAGTQNPNPIPLNSRGEANVYLIPNVAYKLVEADQYGNQIKVTDQVVNNQLITLFGGVDTGSANAYILNFNASFTALANGIPPIYWIPSHNNTGASTLNVNGLGSPQPILNVNGSALGANQIIANQMTEVVYYNGNWILLTVANFTGNQIGTFGQSSTIASASTTDLGGATAHVVSVTGTTTINSFGSSASISAPIYIVTFASALSITGSSAIILPNIGASLAINGGDTLMMEYLGSGNWQVVGYYQSSPFFSLDSLLLSPYTNATTSYTSVVSLTLQAGNYLVQIGFSPYATGGTSDGLSIQFGGTSQWAANSGNFTVVGTIATPLNTIWSPGTYSAPTIINLAANLTIATTNAVSIQGILNLATAGTLVLSAAQSSGPAMTSALAGAYMTARRM